MKKLITIILFTVELVLVNAQNTQLDRTTISSGGGNLSNSQYSISHSIGQITTPTIKKDSITLTQGFQQNEINLCNTVNTVLASGNDDLFVDGVAIICNKDNVTNISINPTPRTLSASLSLVFGLNYQFVLTDSANIIQTGLGEENSFSLNQFEPGSYFIYGISYDESSQFIPITGDSLTASLANLSCFELSDNILEFIVKPDIEPAIILDPNTNDTICSVNTLQLSAESLTSSQGFWTGPENIIFTPNANSNSVTIEELPEEEISFTWNTFLEGCNDTLTDNLSIFFKPQGASQATILTPLPDTVILCKNQPLAISADISQLNPGETGRWIVDNNANVFPSTESSEVEISGLSNGFTTVSWNIQSEGCSNNKDEVVISLQSESSQLFHSDTIICLEQNNILLQAPIQGETYLWSTGEQSQDINVNIEAGSKKTVSLSLTTLDGCTIQDSIEIFRDTLIAEIEAEPICIINGELASATLRAKFHPNSTYLWTPTGETVSTINVSKPDITYEVLVTNEVGCISSASVTVNQEAFELSITPKDTTINPGETIEIVVSGGRDIEWISPLEQLDCLDCFELTVSPVDSLKLTGVVYSEAGCKEEVISNIHVISDDRVKCNLLRIPNIITPGQLDGINDVWYIENLPFENELQIVDRWGRDIYSTRSYQNNWSGKFIGSSDLVPKGTYYYILKIEDDICKGSITVLR